MPRKYQDKGWLRLAGVSHIKRVCPGCKQAIYLMKDHARCMDKWLAEEDAKGTNPSFTRTRRKP
jgi:hypothetical protein